MKKRMLAALLALVMVLGLASGALASEEPETAEEAVEAVEEIEEAEEAEAVEEIGEAEETEEIEEASEKAGGSQEEAEREEDESADPLTEEEVSPELESSVPALDGTASSGTCGEGMTWTLSDEGVLTITGTGAVADYASEFGVPWNPQRDSIRTVRVEPGVTAIGERAFLYCQNLTGIELPEGLVRIGSYAFSWCKALTEVELPDTVTEIGRDAFYHCESLAELTVPAGVRSIEQNTFSWCRSLRSVTLPEGLESIGAMAFESCPLTELTLPEGLGSIGASAFVKCSLIRELDIPEGTAVIGAWAFANCTGLTRVRLPDSLTTLGEYAFQNCTQLTGVLIPPRVERIGSYTFSGCKALAWIALPVTATVIGNSAFNKCSALKDVYYQGGETEWAAIALGAYADSLKKAVIHYYDYREGRDPSACGDDLTWSYAGGTLTITGTGDMWDWETAADVPWAKHRGSITAVELPAGLTSVGDRAFSGCGKLEKAELGDLPELARVGEESFAWCSALKAAAFDTALTTLGDRAFLDCSGLEEIIFFGSAPDFGESCLASDTGNVLQAWFPAGNDSWMTVSLPNSGKRPTRWAQLNADGSVPKRCFVESEDAWGFLNAYGNLAPAIGGKYDIYKEDYDRLLKYLNETDRDRITLTADNKKRLNIYNRIDGGSKVEWDGSCYGMSDFAILIAQGKYSFNVRVSEIVKGRGLIDRDVVSAVNFYHVQQYLIWHDMRESFFRNSGIKDQMAYLEALALQADSLNAPFILEIEYPSGGGNANHAVVAYGIETGSWEKTAAGITKTYDHRLLIYDSYDETSATASENCDLYYTTDQNGVLTYCLPARGIIRSSDGVYAAGMVYTEMHEAGELNMVDYETGNLGYRSKLAENLVDYKGNCTICYEDHVITVDGNKYCFDNEGWEYALRFSDAADDGKNEKEGTIILPKSGEYTISGGDGLSCRLTTEHFALTGVADGGGTMTVDAKNGGVTVDRTSAGACYIRLTANNGYTPLSLPVVEVEAEKAESLRASVTEKGVLIGGGDLTAVTVTGGDFLEECTLDISTDRDEVLVVTEEDTLTAYVDMDGDGDFETPLISADLPASDTLRGDVNGDGRVNRQDRVYLARHLAGWTGYETVSEAAADVDANGKVNRQDRVYLARLLAGWTGYGE